MSHFSTSRKTCQFIDGHWVKCTLDGKDVEPEPEEMRTLNLDRTRAAVAAYDEADAALTADFSKLSNSKVLTRLNALEGLSKDVGVAFAKDTADRNSFESASLVGPKDPWLRRLLGK